MTVARGLLIVAAILYGLAAVALFFAFMAGWGCDNWWHMPGCG